MDNIFCPFRSFFKNPTGCGKRLIFQDEEAATLQKKVESLPKDATREKLAELKRQIEGVDEAALKVRDLDREIENAEKEKINLLQRITERFSGYEWQLEIMEGDSELTVRERALLTEVKRLLKSLGEDLERYKTDRETLFEDEPSAPKRAVIRAAKNYFDDYKNFDTAPITQAIAKLPDSGLGPADMAVIRWVINAATRDESRHGIDRFLLTALLPKIAPGTFQDIDDLHWAIWSRTGADIKRGYAEKMASDRPGTKEALLLVIDLDDGPQDSNEIGRRLDLIPDRAIDDFALAKKMVQQFAEHFPGLLKVLDKKIPDGKIEDRGEIDSLLQTEKHQDLVFGFFEKKTALSQRDYFVSSAWRARLESVTLGKDYYTDRRLEPTGERTQNIQELLQQIPDGLLKDQEQYPKLLYLTQLYPAAAWQMLVNKFADKTIQKAETFKEILRYTSSNPEIQKQFRLAPSIDNMDDLLDILKNTSANPDYQITLISLYKGPLTKTKDLLELLSRLRQNPKAKQTVISIFQGPPEKTEDYLKVDEYLQKNDPEFRLAWLEKVPDGFLKIENPMMFLHSFGVANFQKVDAKIAPETWRNFLSDPTKYINHDISVFLTGTIKEYSSENKKKEEDRALAIKYARSVFKKTFNFSKDEEAEWIFLPELKTKADLIGKMKTLPSLPEEDRAKLLELWNRVREGKHELETYAAAKITSDDIKSDAYFEALKKEGKYYLESMPEIAYALCKNLPKERLTDSDFLEMLFRTLGKNNHPSLADFLTQKIDVHQYPGSQEVSYQLERIKRYPLLQAAYLKNLPKDFFSRSESFYLGLSLRATSQAPQAQIRLLEAITLSGNENDPFHVREFDIRETVIKKELTEEAALYLAHRLTKIIETDKSLREAMLFGGRFEDVDIAQAFKDYPKAQLILVDYLLPYFPCFSDRYYNIEWKPNLPGGISFLTKKNRPKVAQKFQEMLRGYGGSVSKFLSQVFLETQEDLTEKNMNEFVRLFSVGSNAGVYLEIAWPEIREKFLKEGYAAIKDYWEFFPRLDYRVGTGGSETLRVLYKQEKEALRDPEKRKAFLLIASYAERVSPEFFQFVYRPLLEEGVNFKDKDQVKKTVSTFWKYAEAIDDREALRNLLPGINLFKKDFNVPFFEAMELAADFYTKKNDRLIRTVEAHYQSGDQNLRPLKNVLITLYGGKVDALVRFVTGINLEIVLRGYQQSSVEEKVLAAQAILPYWQTDKRIVPLALHLKKEDVDAFLRTESQKPGYKLSNYYYIVMGYDLVGSAQDKEKALRQIDFTKLMKEKLSIEVFGILEQLQAPLEIWEKVTREFPLNLHNLKLVERARQKLVEISVEKANQVIEIKAQEYIEGPVTADNLAAKIEFAKIWSQPEAAGVEVGYGSDKRFVLDVYTQAAARMKNGLKRYCFETQCRDVEKWQIFTPQELEEIRRVTLATKAVEAKKETPALRPSRPSIPKKPKGQDKVQAAPTLQKSPEEQQKEDRLAALRQWVLESSASQEVRGMIFNKDQLEKRLALYLGFRAEGLEAQMNLVREQVISYINRNIGQNEDLLDEEVMWKGKSTELEDVLPDLDIKYIATATGVGTKAKKFFVNLVTDPRYAYRRTKQAAEATKIEFEKNPSVVRSGLYFESGFEGGGESYKGKKVELQNSDIQPCGQLYTIERGGKTEGIVFKVNPKKGARFDFEVQVGATTKGNKGNLAELLQKRHGANLMLDTVGAMVQGAGMPISMIFEDGEPKNKKTTMEGQRDGLVVFGPSDRMSVMKKTAIHYHEISAVMNLNSFESSLQKEIAKAETKLYAELPPGDKFDPTALQSKNQELLKTYRELLEMQELFNQWKNGKPLNYASQESYLPQKLFWKIARHGHLSGFIESLYVENGKNMVKEKGAGAHKRLLLEFTDGTYGIYDSRIPLYDQDVAEILSRLKLDGVGVRNAINLDTGMADDTRLYDKNGHGFQVGFTSNPVGTNRIGIYYKPPQ